MPLRQTLPPEQVLLCWSLTLVNQPWYEKRSTYTFSVFDVHYTSRDFSECLVYHQKWKKEKNKLVRSNHFWIHTEATFCEKKKKSHKKTECESNTQICYLPLNRKYQQNFLMSVDKRRILSLLYITQSADAKLFCAEKKFYFLISVSGKMLVLVFIKWDFTTWVSWLFKAEYKSTHQQFPEEY